MPGGGDDRFDGWSPDEIMVAPTLAVRCTALYPFTDRGGAMATVCGKGSRNDTDCGCGHQLVRPTGAPSPGAGIRGQRAGATRLAEAAPRVCAQFADERGIDVGPARPTRSQRSGLTLRRRFGVADRLTSGAPPVTRNAADHGTPLGRAIRGNRRVMARGSRLGSCFGRAAARPTRSALAGDQSRDGRRPHTVHAIHGCRVDVRLTRSPRPGQLLRSQVPAGTLLGGRRRLRK